MEENLALLGSILLALGIVSITFVIGALRNVSKKQNPKLNGVKILQILGDSKAFPIETIQGWNLCNFFSDHRIWVREFEADGLAIPLSVHGCFSRIKGSSQSILNILKDITKYQEWDCTIKSVNAITVAEENKDGPADGKTPKGLPVQHDIISAETDFIANTMVKYLNKISLMAQGESLLKKTCIVHRYWHKEENGCCWLLEIDEDLQEWCFYLFQPVQGLFEMDQCMATVLHCPHKDRGLDSSHIPAMKLAALQHHLIYRKLQSIPLNNISLPTTDETMEYIDTSVNGNNRSSKSKNIFGDIARFVNSEEKPEGPNLFSKFKNLIEEKKEWYEKEKKKRQSTPQASPKNETAKDILQHSSAKNFFQQITQKAKGQSFNGTDQTGSEDEGDEPQSAGARRSLFKMLRPNTVSGAINSPEQQSLPGEEGPDNEKGALEPSEASSDDLLDQLHKLGSVIGNVQIETSCKTAMNQAAADIMAEKVRVANIDITKPYDEQAEQTGGWIYCGLEKDIVILRKIHEEGSHTQSYLGKGMIPVPPEAVFEALKNPRTRYTYDEMLKKMEVLHDFGNGLKVIYLYHEISQLFKKEARDFVILQNERVEGSKFMITMRSVGWPGSPETEDVVRGKFLPSGWIIEPCMKEGKKYSMVTYIVQMELASNRSNNGYLVEELAAKQPLSIAFLRQYLVPSSAINRSVSNSQLQKRKQSSATLATVAASANPTSTSSSTSPDIYQTFTTEVNEENMSTSAKDLTNLTPVSGGAITQHDVMV